jgi:hypothetical protein
VTPLPTNAWEFLGTLVLSIPGIIGAIAAIYVVIQNRGIHHQLNSMTDARVAVASQAGHAEGMLAGAAGERENVAKELAAQIAAEVARVLQEQGKVAIAIKSVGSKP